MSPPFWTILEKLLKTEQVFKKLLKTEQDNFVYLI